MGAEARQIGADKTHDLPKQRVAIVTVGGHLFLRGTREPGWVWSEHARAEGATGTCQREHIGVLLAGRMAIRTDDGAEAEVRAGDAYRIPPGHDGWVLGDDQVEFLEFHLARTGPSSRDEPTGTLQGEG